MAPLTLDTHLTALPVAADRQQQRESINIFPAYAHTPVWNSNNADDSRWSTFLFYSILFSFELGFNVILMKASPPPPPPPPGGSSGSTSWWRIRFYDASLQVLKPVNDPVLSFLLLAAFPPETLLHFTTEGARLILAAFSLQIVTHVRLWWWRQDQRLMPLIHIHTLNFCLFLSLCWSSISFWIHCELFLYPYEWITLH